MTFYKTKGTQKEAYAIHRMSSAIDRMLGNGSDDSRRRAARWAVAWGVLSGARIPKGFATRKRN